MAQTNTISAQTARVPGVCYNCERPYAAGDKILIAHTTGYAVHAKTCGQYEVVTENIYE